MHTYDYLFVGAGLFSATAANILSGRGKRCLVIDRRNHVAGNCYTEARSGINVHAYGAHIFHTDDRAVWDFVTRFAKFNDFVNSPIAIHSGKRYNLPFNMNTFSAVWPDVAKVEEAKARILEQAAKICGEPKNLEEQAISLVGLDVYELLIRGYTEKQWGRRCIDLPASIIRRLPVRFTYDNNYYDDKYQGIPVGGYTGMVERMLAGIEVRTGCDYLCARYELDSCAERVVFTGLVDEFFDYRLGRLAYRSLRFETEEIATKDYQGNAVINYTDAATPYTRVIEHKHFEFGSQESTVISREYPAEYAPRAEAGGGARDGGAEPYYPINDDANTQLYNRYADMARSQRKALFGGRLGTYRYLDMDDCVGAAMKMAGLQL